MFHILVLCAFLLCYFVICFVLSSHQQRRLRKISIPKTGESACNRRCRSIAKCKSEFPDVDDYILYSVHPRILKADPNGLHWQFVWKAKAFPHHKALIVRVYMKEGLAIAEREQVAGQY